MKFSNSGKFPTLHLGQCPFIIQCSRSALSTEFKLAQFVSLEDDSRVYKCYWGTRSIWVVQSA